MAPVANRWGFLISGLLLVGGCSRKGPPPSSEQPPRGVVLQEQGEIGQRLDLIEMLPQCELRHRGILLDLGAPSVDGMAGWNLGPELNERIEREGASWLRVASRTIHYRFVLEEPQPVFFSAKIKSLTSKSASVLLDGKVVGSLPLTRGQTRVSSTSILPSPVPPGSHMLSLRFSGVLRDGTEPVADVDWLRVGFPDDDPAIFAAPTQGDVLQNLASLGGVPHRPLALRIPTSLRCFLAFPEGARLRTSLALLGSGDGEVEFHLLEDGQPSTLLKTSRVLGAEKPTWTDVDLPLPSPSGRLATLEIAATHGSQGSRLLLGDPRILSRKSTESHVPRAKAVVVVVISSLNPERLPPWAPDRPLPTFDALARDGVLFENYRAPSSLVGPVMASLMTGLSPRQHTVEDSFSRIPESLPTLATLARDASIQNAMFTVHPATSAAFGFARGWDRFSFYSPVSPAHGTKPVEELISWIGEHGNRSSKGLLAVVHTRGIHPPYDLSPGEFAQLPPHPEQEYAGVLDPRRAGQILERLRRKKRGQAQVWNETDRMRLEATIDSALAQTDRSLSNLIDALRKARLWNDTLLIITSDVAGATDPSALPFASTLELREDVLRTPLYVHFPGGSHQGERSLTPVTMVDLTATILRSLGLDAAVPGEGKDLFSLVGQEGDGSERALVASLGERLSVRWGDWRLMARSGVPPQLCNWKADSRCEQNRAEALPLLTQALWRRAFEYEDHARPPKFQRPKREPATLEPDTSAALNVWGN